MKRLLTTIFSIIILLSLQGQNVISNGSMENSTGWTIYQLDVNPLICSFNYTSKVPVGGSDGCLQVTNSTTAKSKNLLLWQYVTLDCGKTYLIDANVKALALTNYWIQFYLSTVTPVAGKDYAPNGNADTHIGFSSWDSGCGSNYDGLMSQNACFNKLPFTVPGKKGETVNMVFALKIGTMDAKLEAYFDNVRLYLNEDYFLLGSDDGTLDAENRLITNVTPTLSIAKFVSGLHYPSSATLQVVGKTSGKSISLSSTAVVSDTLLIRLTGNQTTEYALQLRPKSTDNNLLAIMGGTINNSDETVTDVPLNLKIFQLESSIGVSQYATFKLSNESGLPLNLENLVSDDLQVKVTAENGNIKTYSISVGTQNTESIEIADSTATMEFAGAFNYNLSGHIHWEITDKSRPFRGSLLNIKSDDVWLFFKNIKPSEFNSRFLKYILIDGSKAVKGVNVRVVQYVEGTVVISHPADYKPLDVFVEKDLAGSSMQLGQYTYYKSAQLGSFNNAIKSFRLKKGYMATFNQEENGKGYSRVYIADIEDIVVDSLPVGLFNEVSFIRVFPWRWVGKKAWRGDDAIGNLVNATSRYDYNTNGTSTPDIEYVPMYFQTYWNTPSNMPDKGEYTHYLGFNEPDHVEQSNMTISKIIELWPQLMQKGLRLGSPAITDMNYLYQFIDLCDDLDYRVDFIALHCYQSGQTVQSYWNFLNSVYKRTGRPLWITEWNNGCNWTYDATHPAPTLAENGVKIADFTHMLDTASFVERYFVWDGCNESLRMTYSGTSTLTPAGKAYQQQISTMAFNHDYEFVKEYTLFPEKAQLISPSIGNQVGYGNVSLKWTPGKLAKSHQIYIGTSPYYQVSQKTGTQTTYNPGQLLPNTHYYWRIDEINDGKITKGDVWDFVTTDFVNSNVSIELSDITVYPQPVGDVLYIQGIVGSVGLRLVNTLGQVVLEQKNNTGEVNVNHLPSGIYLLQINDMKTIKVFKR